MASSKGRIYPVFVDNIHYEAETKDLRKVFQRIGHVQEVTILSHHGFVAFADPQDAVESIRKLDGYKFFGRRIKVEATEELDDYLRQRRKYIEEEHLRRKSVEQHDRRDRCHRSKYRSQSEDHRLSTKRKITLSQKQDLRQVLNKRNKIESDSEFSDKQRTRITDDNASDISEISEENEESDKESEKDYKQANKLPKGMQELYIGNLVSPVDKSDLEQLLDGYGAVKSVKIVEDHALVRIACDADTAQDAIDTLDQSEWMDNNIHVKFSVKSDIIKKEKDKYEIWLWSDSLSRDSFLEDMCDLLSDYGEVIDRTWRPDLDSLSFEIKASEDQILDCVRHLNTFHQYKDGKIRAKFVDDSEQEAKLSKEIEDYPYQLIPDSHLPSTSSSSKSPPDKKIKEREIWLWTPAAFKKTFLKDMETMVEPFGKVKDKGWKNDHIYITLESSEKQACRCIAEVHGSSYKNAQVRAKFADNTPEDDLFKEPLYSILLRKYDKILIPNDLQVQASTSSKIIMAFNKQTLNKSPSLEMPMIKKSSTKKAVEGPSYKIVYDSAILENVEGRVYSMSSKLILISFHVGNAGQSLRFARLKPGHMHINGRNNFGYIVKDFRYADWPESIREVFKLEQSVMMDLRQLSQPEKEEMRNLTHENVMYDVSLLWKSQKPENLIRKLNKPTYKATVIKLWPKWAILQPVMVYGDQALILMLREEFYTPEDPDKNQSLLNHIEIGDTLAILAAPTDYLAMAEKARSLDYFNEPTNNLKYQTILGWPLKSEIDPYAILGKEKKVDVSEVEFFASAVNLNFALPSEREATFKKLKGVIDEIHVPSGGIISLKDSQDKNQADQKVYFHRSRLFVNGVKLASNAVLEDEISVGDPVQIDITKNQFDLTSTYVSGTDAFWVGLSVKVSTVDRGQTIANKLRAEAIDPSAYANKLCQGRIVYLKPSEHDIVNAGIAVIDSGPYAGQRLEFEADQCYLFGYCLQSADLSYLFNKNEPVWIMVKSYNSFLLDRLWIGTDLKSNPSDNDGRMQMQKYLFDHGLERSSFENMLRGMNTTRPFIPLQGQMYKGTIKGLKPDDEGPATTLVIEADVGELLFLEVPRENVFVYGHWMGKADLSYIFDKDEVCFEVHQVFGKEEQAGLEVPKASLLWLGDQNSRPKYLGQSTKSVINAEMDEALWKFVKEKKMDEKMFRALVEGRLPPKQKPRKNINMEVEAPDGTKVQVDDEVLAQAALLKQMKDKFGSDAMMKAMMLLVSTTNESKSEDKK